MFPHAIVVENLDVGSGNTVLSGLGTNKSLIYLGDPSHLQDGTMHYVVRGIQGAFIGKDGT